MAESTEPLEEQIRAMSDEELLAAFWASSGEVGEPVYEAYVAEVERRRLEL